MTKRSIWAARLVVTALIAGALPLAAGTASAATQLQGSFRGHAYGSFANAKAGKVATTLGRSAFIPCPCNGTGGEVRSETVDSVKSGRAVRADNIYDTVFTDKTATTAVVNNTSKVSGINLLGGRVRAKSIKAVAHTDADARTIRSNAKKSEFVGLSILGHAVRNSDVQAGSRTDLPGIGYLLLEDVRRGGDGVSSGSLTVNMVTIVVQESNQFDLPVGSHITIAHAKSGYNRHEPVAVVGGSAFAASAKASAPSFENKIGRAAAIYLGCEGTKGKTRRNDVNTLSVPGVLSSGTGETTALGDQTGDLASAKTTAQVQNVDLFHGLITADVVNAEAFSTFDTGTQTGSGSTAGSSFGNLAVNGAVIPLVNGMVAPNTVLDLPGVGRDQLREESTRGDATRGAAQVVMIHITITDGTNPYGLPVGTNIFIADARSKAMPF